MKIATYNVNSIRQRLPIVINWLAEHQPDVMCLQETKVQDKDFPIDAIERAGYHATFRGIKAYNGVATLTRAQPERVQYGLEPGPDVEDARVIQTGLGGITIINSYVPQGYSITSEKYAFKLAWFRRLRAYLEASLNPSDPVLWVGDMNVAPEPIDVYHADRRVNDVDFHIDTRMAYKEANNWGFIDVFRRLHPDRIQYTYWDYYRNALERNFGWRIDHILATEALARRCRAVEVDMAVRTIKGASDHTVVWAEFDDSETSTAL
jgi:exodeoxyribonuclease III